MRKILYYFLLATFLFAATPRSRVNFTKMAVRETKTIERVLTKKERKLLLLIRLLKKQKMRGAKLRKWLQRHRVELIRRLKRHRSRNKIRKGKW